MTGVDISNHQRGLTVRQIKDAGHAFAILKITEGTGYKDPCSFTFYSEASANHFPVGGYCYSHATTPEDATAEADFLLGIVRTFPLPLGVFLDIEKPEQLALPAADLYRIIEAWCSAVRSAGYTPGVYSSEGTLFAKVDPNKLPEDCLVWIAHYGKQPDITCDLWQCMDCGTIGGYDGPVDVDVVRSARFERLVKGETPAPAPQPEPAPEPEKNFWDWKIAEIQFVMQCDGYWGTPDGLKSPAFFAALRQYTADMATC